MLIDTAFDVRTDAGGKDPDTFSPTLSRYHQLLWIKPLPSGVLFDLVPSGPPYRYRHSSAAGDFTLSSDASYRPTRGTASRRRSSRNSLPPSTPTHFNTIGYTIGGLILWPKNRIDGKWTINQARGCLRTSIGDRMDLTLECIRRHYRGERSPLGAVLGRYAAFFAAFEDFHSYVDFWLLQDMVTDDYSAARFFTPFNDFKTPAIPQDLDTYVGYRRRTIEFILARNARIEQLP